MVAGGIAREQGFDILALTIDYNQRHRVELESAARIARELGALRHVVLPLDLTQFGGSALTADIDVPKDGAGTREDGGVPITYVPARNTIFLSLCLGWAEAAGARDMVIGVNALDYSGYPDCRPEFIDAFQKLALLGTKAGDAKESFEAIRVYRQLDGLRWFVPAEPLSLLCRGSTQASALTSKGARCHCWCCCWRRSQRACFRCGP